jgi:hypothetical protein
VSAPSLLALAIRHRTVVEVNAALRMLSYTAGYPANMDDAARRSDEADAAEADCPACGSLGLILSPYHRLDQYEAVLVCNNCGCASVLV